MGPASPASQIAGRNDINSHMKDSFQIVVIAVAVGLPWD